MSPKSLYIDSMSKKLRESDDVAQIPYGDSRVSADHIEKCPKLLAALGLSDERKKTKSDNTKKAV